MEFSQRLVYMRRGWNDSRLVCELSLRQLLKMAVMSVMATRPEPELLPVKMTSAVSSTGIDWIMSGDGMCWPSKSETFRS